MSTVALSIGAAVQLVVRVFGACGMPERLAQPAARALVAAEGEGLPSHAPCAGSVLRRSHMRSCKVVADATPLLVPDGADLRLDAASGLAFWTLRDLPREIPHALHETLLALACDSVA